MLSTSWFPTKECKGFPKMLSQTILSKKNWSKAISILLMKYIVNKYHSLTLDFEWPRQSRQYLIFFKFSLKPLTMFSYPFLWVQVQYSKHPCQGHNVLFLQRTHVASMYQIIFPKLNGNILHYVFIIHFMKIFITLKTFNVNLLYHINLA